MSEKILEAKSSQQFKDDYIRYGIYILYRRVLSDYRDGLKPVQRRILWAMYKNTKAISTFVKSAAVVGDTMKLYHPHSNCISGDTIIYYMNGDGKDCTDTIENIYRSGVQELDIITVEKDGSLRLATATNFRIGQYTNSIYHITINIGDRTSNTIRCTANHPFLFANMEWIKAEDIKYGDILFSIGMDTDSCNTNFMRQDDFVKVTNIEIEHVENVPMYDFTVKDYENMLIPVNYMKDGNRDYYNFICIHNSALYGTMKPMANWFETNMPLIEASGNFGTFQGDPAAAERYTECRLSKFAIENVLADVMDSEKSVDWSPTYSGASVEPDYLPVKVPLLLINGSFGIGLGMRADIPTHNLNEVIDATLMLMDNPDAEVVLVPDHCMRCEIFETDFAKICKAGFGHYRIRGVIDIEDYKGRKALVIKSVPNLTYLDSVTNKIEDLIKAKKIIQIDNCFDESTINEMRYVIVLKPGADPNYVKEVIYKNTTLEQTLRINFETLNGLSPLRMSYKAYLTSFIDFRKLTKFRVYQNRLQAVQTKLHERDAYIKVLESGEVDNIIAMIKKQRTVDDGYLIEYLVKKLKITDLQARYIIDANLKKLSYGYLEKYKREAAELNAQRAELIRHIMDDKVIEDDIRQELLEVKRKYGRPRNCRIISNAEVNDIPQGAMTIAITEKNFVRKVPAGVNIGNFKNDAIRTCINIDNTDSVVIFDEMGKVFKLPVHKIPFTDKNTNGTDIRFLVKSLTANINTIIPESVMKNLASVGCHNDKHYLVTLTKNGLIKRMDLDDFITVPPSGILYAKIDAGDCVKDIVIAHSALSLIVYADRKAVIIPVNDVPYLKRNTKGSKSMSNVDYVDGLCVISSDCTDICVITESGKINRINIIHGMPNSTKGKSGSNLIKLSPKDKIVAVVSGNERDIIHIKCVSTEYTFRIGNLEIGSSISAGFKALTTRNDKIIHCWVQKQ